jgi:hypothetical protein
MRLNEPALAGFFQQPRRRVLHHLVVLLLTLRALVLSRGAARALPLDDAARRAVRGCARTHRLAHHAAHRCVPGALLQIEEILRAIDAPAGLRTGSTPERARDVWHASGGRTTRGTVIPRSLRLCRERDPLY